MIIRYLDPWGYRNSNKKRHKKILTEFLKSMYSHTIYFGLTYSVYRHFRALRKS